MKKRIQNLSKFESLNEFFTLEQKNFQVKSDILGAKIQIFFDNRKIPFAVIAIINSD